jgi:type II secretory pathway component GspD/PulD (secretin)/Spy/CpxP family protein refolding chaperone
MKNSTYRLAFAMALMATLLGASLAMAQRPGGGNRGGGFGGGGPGGFGGGGFGGGGFGGGSTTGLLLRESNAEDLKLTEEQKTKIREVSDKQREDTRIRDIFGKMRDATEEERTALQADIAKIAEEQRKQAEGELKLILSPEQFTRYRQLAVQSRGVSALADSDIAGELKLSDEQLAKLKAIAEENSKRRTEMFEKMRESGGRGNFEEMRTKGEELRKEFEEKRLAVLTDAQRQQWTAMKGPEPVAAADASRPSTSPESASRPVRVSAPVQNPDAVGSQTIGDDKPRKPVISFGKSADEYASAKSAAVTASLKGDKPADGQAEKVEPPKPEKISFNFRHAPWADVLKTFAELAGLTLDLNVVPPGTFNYFDEKEYTATEALDVINGYLLQKGYVLVRRDQFLVVVNIDDPIPPNLVPKVNVSDLPKRGKNELMNVVLRIENITAEEAAEEAKELIGPQGKVVALKRSSSISVTDIGSNLQQIHDLLVSLGAAPTDIAFKSYTLTHIDAQEADDKVRAMFGLQRGVESVAEGARSRSYDRGGEMRDRDGRPIPMPAPTNTKPKVQVSYDERTNRLLVTANPAEHKIIEELLKTIDVEELPGATRRPRSREPYLHVYSVKTADAQEVAKTLNVLHPGCVVNEDGRARRLHIFATPTQHEAIERMIKQLDGEGVSGGTSVAVIPTGRIDSLTAVATLHTLFAAEKDAAPSLTPHPTGYGLIVRGTADQVAQIKTLLTQMDPNALKGDPQKGNVRTIPLGGRDPEEFSQMLKQFWGAKNSNPIIVVPSNSQPVRDQRVPSAAPSSNESAPSRETTRPPRAASRPQADLPLDKPTSAKRKAPKVESAPIAPPRAQATQASIFAVSLLEETAPKAAEPVLPKKAKKNAANSNKKANPNKQKKAARKAQAAPKSESTPKAAEPAAETPANDENGEPIRVFSSGGNLVITSKDEEALDDMEQLIELMQEATPSKPRWTIFYLRSADASETAAMLERLFPTSSVSSGTSSSTGMLGELTGGISSMGRSLMNATGLSSAMAGSLTLRIIPDMRSNALYVAGPAEQVREVEAMLRVLDASELPEQLRDRTPHRIQVEHAEVEDVAAIVREIYKDDMTPEGQQPGQQPNPFAMLMGGAGGSSRSGRSGQQAARTIKLTLSVDNRTNTLIVSSSEALFRQIEALVHAIDDDARAANRTVRVVDIKGNNSAAVQTALSAMYSKIKTGSSARSSSSRGSSSSSSGSSSSSPPFGSGGFTPGMPFMPPFGGFGGSPFGGDRGSDGSRSSRFGGSPFGGGGPPGR